MQLFYRHLPVFLLIFPWFTELPAQNRLFIRTVVIDAGHGGHDPGAIGHMAQEKNINLSIALKLGNLIQRNLKDVRVIYTRDRDRFVELYRRAEIANENRADLFISIHCNANKMQSLRGAETYIMGLHKSEANLNTAKQENASILLESDYQSTYNGFDPNSDESYIIFSLNQNSNLDQSTDFAAAVQDQMEERVGLNNRG
ncbi:MAG: N-acetylmuramoyl-L-alanine amidase, partial [Bacteroidota bacterium]